MEGDTSHPFWPFETGPDDAQQPPTDRQTIAWLLSKFCGGVLRIGPEEMAEINRMRCERERGECEWVFRAVKIEGMGS